MLRAKYLRYFFSKIFSLYSQQVLGASVHNFVKTQTHTVRTHKTRQVEGYAGCDTGYRYQVYLLITFSLVLTCLRRVEIEGSSMIPFGTIED